MRPGSQGSDVKPRLLDLFCGAGGASVGYRRAGFDVVGVDINPQPNYPFEFDQADALVVLDEALKGAAHPSDIGEQFDAIHASPPCQAFSTIAKQARVMGRVPDGNHVDLVEPTRELLQATGLPYVIENVVGAPLENYIQLCGSSFGLNVERHRWFELGGFSMLAPPCAHHWQTPRFPMSDKRRTYRRVVPVYGGNQVTTVDIKNGSLGEFENERKLREWAMGGVDWMTPYELTQAIPPAYTEYIGAALLAHVQSVAA